jgi:thiamine-phosphate pyrophosphorylase
MPANLTPAAERALQSAQEIAASQGATEVQPPHLLLALLQEEEGRAGAALTRAGADLVQFLRRQAAAAGPSSPPAQPLPLTLGVQTILASAGSLARELSVDRTVTSDQVVLTVLREQAHLRAELEALGLDMARLEEAVCGARPPLELDEPLRLAKPGDKIEAARILDAGANRAREALRVIEDYCRFVLDDAFLSRELKTLRHDLTETLAGLPGPLLLEARDTLRDVGTWLTTAREEQRFSPLEVVQANLKRLQEALRSLEEFGKLRGPDLGSALEKLRYRSYTLERAIVLGTTARERLADARLYVLITGAGCAAAIDWTIQEAAAGGVQIVQLREKQLSDRELLERAKQVRRWTRQVGVLFLMNDRPDLARLAEADGVHLGQDDLPIKEARRVIGPDALIGVSTHNLDQVRQAVRDGAGYIGVGPTFPSNTKAFAELAGLDFVRQAAAETTLPAFVLGGISLANLPQAIAAGARRVAVSQALCQAEDPQAVARQFRALLDESARQGP